MKIGVLALQGSFSEHIAVLQRLGVKTMEVRLPEHLDDIDGLIIPGGESTTIGKLAAHYQMMEPLCAFGRQKAVWGTCAGAIFLSKDAQRDQPLLNLMDIRVARNAFGSQIASFETDLVIPELCDADPRPYHAIFIRAPEIVTVNGNAQVLARLPDGRIVAAQQNQWLATAFHPELTTDARFHQYFLTIVKRTRK